MRATKERVERVERGAGLQAILAPLATMGPVDQDIARFCRLDDEEAAREVDAALYALPELRRYFAYRLLKALTHAVLAGGGWTWDET